MTGRGLEMSRVLVVLAQSQWKKQKSALRHRLTPLPAFSRVLIQTKPCNIHLALIQTEMSLTTHSSIS